MSLQQQQLLVCSLIEPLSERTSAALAALPSSQLLEQRPAGTLLQAAPHNVVHAAVAAVTLLLWLNRGCTSGQQDSDRWQSVVGKMESVRALLPLVHTLHIGWAGSAVS